MSEKKECQVSRSSSEPSCCPMSAESSCPMSKCPYVKSLSMDDAIKCPYLKQSCCPKFSEEKKSCKCTDCKCTDCKCTDCDSTGCKQCN